MSRKKAGAPQRRGLADGVPGGAAAPVGKGGRAEAARAARWGPRRGGSPGGERRARRSGEGWPMGPPAGRQPRWGKAGAPKRRGLPDGVPGGAAAPVGKGGRAAAARAARSAAEGQHESSGGRARRSGGSARVKRRGARRSGGSARVKRRPRPPWWRVSTSQAEAAPAVAGCGANGKGRQDKPICLSSGCNKDQDYLNLRLRAASDFFLRLTEGFS